MIQTSSIVTPGPSPNLVTAITNQLLKSHISQQTKKKRIFSKTHSLPLFTSSPSIEASTTTSKGDIDEYINKCITDAIENGIEILDFSCLGITELPSTLSDLNGMISFNSVGTFQPFIQLFLQGNLLRELDPLLFSISNITVLSLRNNQLTWLPSCIANLTRLVELNIGGNQFACVPKELERLTQLKVFNPYPNPFITSDISNIEDIDGCPYFIPMIKDTDTLQELSCRWILNHSIALIPSLNIPIHLGNRIKHVQKSRAACFACGSLYYAPNSYHVEFITLCTKPDIPAISFFCCSKGKASADHWLYRNVIYPNHLLRTIQTQPQT